MSYVRHLRMIAAAIAALPLLAPMADAKGKSGRAGLIATTGPGSGSSGRFNVPARKPAVVSRYVCTGRHSCVYQKSPIIIRDHRSQPGTYVPR